MNNMLVKNYQIGQLDMGLKGLQLMVIILIKFILQLVNMQKLSEKHLNLYQLKRRHLELEGMKKLLEQNMFHLN